MGHAGYRKRRSVTRAAARIVLVLAAMTLGGAIVHFSYTAYESSQCYEADASSLSSTEAQPRRPVDSGDCREIIASTEQHQRTDAAIAVLAVMLMIGAAVRLSKASHRTRRVVLVAEIVVVAVGIVYTILLATALR